MPPTTATVPKVPLWPAAGRRGREGGVARGRGEGEVGRGTEEMYEGPEGRGESAAKGAKSTKGESRTGTKARRLRDEGGWNLMQYAEDAEVAEGGRGGVG